MPELIDNKTITRSMLHMFVHRERTTMMSILTGVGIAVFPLAEYLSGQIFNVCNSLQENSRV